MTHALIDADIPIYEVASLCEVSIGWPHDGLDEVLWTRHAHLDEAWARLQDSFQNLMEKAGASTATYAVSDGANWRKDVYGDYKSNRKASVKPLLVPVLRDKVAADLRGRHEPKLEGDDILGILATKPNAGDTIIVTIDKDLKTIPGKHYNFRKDEFFEVTQAEANRFHLIQSLMGDQTDGFPGCPGIGPKKAENLIPDPVSDDDVLAVWNEVILPAYAKKDLCEGFALSQARCARILRASDFNPKTREVILWTP